MTNAQILEKITKAYDIRGLYPEELNERLAACIGKGFAKFCESSEILVGRDMRTSSLPLAEAFIAGVTACSVGVIDIGLCSTDMLYFASGKFDLPGAMFTASHNPSDYNGIKFCLKGAYPISKETGLLAIAEVAKDALINDETFTIDPTRLKRKDVIEDFRRHVLSFIDTSYLKNLKIVADTANGMGGLVVPKIFESLPVELNILYEELDGSFPNHPADPIQPENLQDLISRVISLKADIGLAFDGDADRVFLVDDLGVPVSGSTTTGIVAAQILKKHTNAKILYNLICSKAVKETIEKFGGTAIKTRVGHSFIKKEMKRTQSVFGGEHSGHYYFLENFNADSGIIAALIVLEMLGKERRKLSEIRREFEPYAQSGEINFEVADPSEVISTIRKFYAQKGASFDDLDGLTVDMGNWWFNVRPSNTEPLLRVNIEAGNQSELREHLEEIKDIIKKQKE
jgi:phosphomannomutase